MPSTGKNPLNEKGFVPAKGKSRAGFFVATKLSHPVHQDCYGSLIRWRCLPRRAPSPKKRRGREGKRLPTEGEDYCIEESCLWPQTYAIAGRERGIKRGSGERLFLN